MTNPTTETGSLAPRRADGRGRVFELDMKELYYGDFKAVRDVGLEIEKGTITAFIGPSGCGKSTVLRSLNRMNDLKRGFRLHGHVRYLGKDIYAKTVDPVAVRRTIGMVFQKPNPFAMSIFRNVTYGLRLNGYRGNQEERVEQALRGAALWDEVKDVLHKPGGSLSGGQQQRLCIARALAIETDVLLLDEPCSALDPISTAKVEELLFELKNKYTIVIVTHNMQQAARVSERTVFMLNGKLIEYGPTDKMFTAPDNRLTEDYITGRFG